jgi:putative intracellular protease/amidase
MRFQILICDGFDELDAVAPFEVLHNAGLANTGAAAEALSGGTKARRRPGKLMKGVEFFPFVQAAGPQTIPLTIQFYERIQSDHQVAANES